MLESHFGELIALITAICWTATGLAFQQATRQAGSHVPGRGCMRHKMRLLLPFLGRLP